MQRVKYQLHGICARILPCSGDQVTFVRIERALLLESIGYDVLSFKLAAASKENLKTDMFASQDTAKQPQALVTWPAESVRVTAFYLGQLDLGTVNWWESLIGKQPDSKNLRAGFGQLIERGSFDDRVLQLQIQPARIDWLLLPKDVPESVEFPLLGDFEESARFLADLASKWLPDAPALNRLAVGAQFSISTADQSEAIKIIARELPYVQIGWEGIQDFIFQINRPKASKVLPDSGPINRLIKWQTIVRRKIVANLLPEPQTPVTTAEQAGAYRELDISTAGAIGTKTQPPPERLPPERLPELLAELIQNMRDVTLRGDFS